MLGSYTTISTISNDKMNNIMKIIKSLEESGLLTKGVNETIKTETKEQNRRFVSMLLRTLGVGLLGNLLPGKGAITASQDPGKIRAGKGTIRADEGTVRTG